MTDKYGSTLQIGAEVIFVTNANTAPLYRSWKGNKDLRRRMYDKKQWEKPFAYLFPQDRLSGSD